MTLVNHKSKSSFRLCIISNQIMRESWKTFVDLIVRGKSRQKYTFLITRTQLRQLGYFNFKVGIKR